MGLRSDGSIATLFKVEPQARYTKANVTISKKNKDSGEWETDFSIFGARFIGNAHEIVQNLEDKAKIKINVFDLSNKYDKEKKVTYWNLAVFECEEYNAQQNNQKTRQQAQARQQPKKQETPWDMDDQSSDLPF